MDKAKLRELYEKYDLQPADFFKHQHYTIITRQGIEKIIAAEQFYIQYEVIRCEPDFAVFKATITKDNAYLETFGSAKFGDFKNGTTNSWYIAEMAEKRAMSRAALKMSGFYQLGVFGEDESESFKKNV
jgi:hypothetical protein